MLYRYIDHLKSLEITQKIDSIVLNTICFGFINFSKNFREYIKIENLGSKIVGNYSKNHFSCFKYNIFCLHEFFKIFCRIYKDGKPRL